MLVPALTAISLLAAIGLTIWIWEPGDVEPIIEGALTVDTLALGVVDALLRGRAGLHRRSRCARSPRARRATASTTRCCSARSPAWSCWPQSSDLITLFVGIELLSIPLYVLCATELRRRTSLEAGLKYLVIGSVGSATLLYGLALIYGATGAMQFDAHRRGDRRRRAEPPPTRCC